MPPKTTKKALEQNRINILDVDGEENIKAEGSEWTEVLDKKSEVGSLKAWVLDKKGILPRSDVTLQHKFDHSPDVWISKPHFYEHASLQSFRNPQILARHDRAFGESKHCDLVDIAVDIWTRSKIAKAAEETIWVDIVTSLFRDTYNAAIARSGTKSESAEDAMVRVEWHREYQFRAAKDLLLKTNSGVIAGGQHPLLLSMPKPDLCSMFPIFNPTDRKEGLWMSSDIQNFTLQRLIQLQDAHGIISSPSTGLHKDLDEKHLRCFPWLITEVKQPKNRDPGYSVQQIANGAATSLCILHKLSQPHGLRRKRSTVPPVFAFTFVGNQFKVWLAYIKDTGQILPSYNVVRIWKGSLWDLWDAIRLCNVIDKAYTWAVRHLRPWISSHIEQWINPYETGGQTERHVGLDNQSIMPQSVDTRNQSNQTSTTLITRSREILHTAADLIETLKETVDVGSLNLDVCSRLINHLSSRGYTIGGETAAQAENDEQVLVRTNETLRDMKTVFSSLIAELRERKSESDSSNVGPSKEASDEENKASHKEEEGDDSKSDVASSYQTSPNTEPGSRQSSSTQMTSPPESSSRPQMIREANSQSIQALTLYPTTPRMQRSNAKANEVQSAVPLTDKLSLEPFKWLDPRRVNRPSPRLAGHTPQDADHHRARNIRSVPLEDPFKVDESTGTLEVVEGSSADVVPFTTMASVPALGLPPGAALQSSTGQDAPSFSQPVRERFRRSPRPSTYSQVHRSSSTPNLRQFNDSISSPSSGMFGDSNLSSYEFSFDSDRRPTDTSNTTRRASFSTLKVNAESTSKTNPSWTSGGIFSP